MNNAPFFFLADDLALDFLNTASGGGQVTEPLTAPLRLLDWLQEAGAMDAGARNALEGSPPAARLLLEEARLLQVAMAAGLEAWLLGAPVPEPSVFALNRCLSARAVRTEVLQEGVRLVMQATPERSGLPGHLAPVAQSFVNLLLEADPVRVRRCAAPDCRLWFRDTSKNGRRRWCSMARCGNRAKVAAHYRRKQRSDGRTG